MTYYLMDVPANKANVGLFSRDLHFVTGLQTLRPNSDGRMLCIVCANGSKPPQRLSNKHIERMVFAERKAVWRNNEGELELLVILLNKGMMTEGEFIDQDGYLFNPYYHVTRDISYKLERGVEHGIIPDFDLETVGDSFCWRQFLESLTENQCALLKLCDPPG